MAAQQPCRPRSTAAALPTLMEELVEEILLRIPPDEPAHLIRATLVCKAWRRIILSDDNTGCFLCRYRTFHRRRPPLLGFFYNDWDKEFPLGFMPAATGFPSLPAHYLRRAWCVVDYHHGRVLLEHVRFKNLIIWDPISDDWQLLQAHGMGYDSYAAAVLCAAAGGCDHHDYRRGGPFLVVYVGANDATDDDDDDTTINACVYSSETGAWGTPVSSQLGTGSDYCFDKHRAAVIGDDIFFVAMPGARILKYDLVKRCITLFSSPSICSDGEASHNSLPLIGEAPVLMENKDGSLGLASIRGSRLYLWSLSRMVKNQKGIIAAEWAQERVIELHTILPNDKPYFRAYVTGFAEDVGILFIYTTYVGRTFLFQLESGQVREITGPKNYSAAFPFISFFSPCKAPALHNFPSCC